MKFSLRIATTPLVDLIGRTRTPTDAQLESLPFSPGDVTAGTENELQAVVVGKRTTVDLPTAIERSKYYSNIVRRIAVGEASTEVIRELRKFLSENEDQVWENSWVRFPRKYLSTFASELLDQDLRINSDDYQEPRSDRDKFVFATKWGDWVRVPISYLVKLALADVIGTQPRLPAKIRETALNLLPHFSNDLTSPETYSFQVIDSARNPRLGTAIAREMSLRFLFTHLLVEWANKVIGLEGIGQQAAVNLAPHPPVRQRELNNCVSDAFFRELFVSPCLSGWTDGEAKHEYMLLAHQITSRSQINAVGKLREAGIITNNLVVLPNTSSVSLGNNGTHLTLGSKRITKHISDPHSGFTAADAKWIGDLVIKICEHFLPLFVGIYTAAPYRLGFSDFHPERALGFLAHELDYTHLRMLWRHWKRKAHLQVFGHSITPCGPKWIDNLLAGLFQLRGDVVPDYRLIDFPVAWLCTETASALDGQTGNANRLKKDLENMGVSDRNLKLYLPFGLREFADIGFFGFEGRHYSLFESMSDDFAPAADLQQLITLLAYKYAISNRYPHRHLPDDPSSESERRLPFFCAALGLDAFNVRLNTTNDLMRRLAAMTKGSIASRHRGYVRLGLSEYRLALVQLLEEDGTDCIELLGLKPLLEDLRSRIRHQELTAYGKLTNGIMRQCGKSKPLAIDAREFNLAAEQFYRVQLKQRHLREAMSFVRETLKSETSSRIASLHWIFGDLTPTHFLNEIEHSLVNDNLNPDLPAEHWQIIAAVPFKRREDGTWHGVNLTYYGFFNASACVFSCATIITLMGSVGVPLVTTISITCLLFLICLPAAKIVARIVERKSSTFTVGGASFVGIVLLPWIIQAFNNFAAEPFGLTIPAPQMLAAVAIAYAFGEAFGRLACISFGCCYGKLIWQAPIPIQKISHRFCFTFRGETKKVAYEANLLERPLIPIQGVTAIVSSLAGIAGVFFFERSNWTIALLVPLGVTQLWRALSETLRADYRGGGRVSAYQLMAIAALVYCVVWLPFLPTTPAVSPNIINGLRTLASAPVLLFLEALWLVIFLYTGRSSVTAARLSFHVVREKI